MGKIIFWVMVVLAILFNLGAFIGEKIMKKKANKLANMRNYTEN